ncbi:DUF397 domain-containing protein [Kitasatospora aureofaciens]|uniref:DUF397 domain-containing protein n=1 Tax=Kitasatospora aureofaciens TaxID=1894 RepID=UPI0027E03485|nr:DUF397 domain-containing protein [Kitasatospora aureofaciens]
MLDAATWYGAPGDTDGPQIAYMPDGYVVMRHGGDPTAPTLTFDADEWTAFKAAAADGEFNDLREQALSDNGSPLRGLPLPSQHAEGAAGVEEDV